MIKIDGPDITIQGTLDTTLSEMSALYHYFFNNMAKEKNMDIKKLKKDFKAMKKVYTSVDKGMTIHDAMKKHGLNPDNVTDVQGNVTELELDGLKFKDKKSDKSPDDEDWSKIWST